MSIRSKSPIEENVVPIDSEACSDKKIPVPTMKSLMYHGVVGCAHDKPASILV